MYTSMIKNFPRPKMSQVQTQALYKKKSQEKIVEKQSFTEKQTFSGSSGFPKEKILTFKLRLPMYGEKN